MPTYRDEGIVLRTTKLGESDRIVTFVTPGHGKVRAVAKGARKPKSRLRGRVEPLTHVQMLCWKGRELDIVNQVEVVDSHRVSREDLDRLPLALTMLEVVDHVALEHHAMPDHFKMLAGALRSLDEHASPVLLGAFLWKLLALEGVGPPLDHCARCGLDEALVAFDASEGGFLCVSCRRGQSVSEETLSLIGRILGGDLRGALGEPAGRATAEVERLATLATEHHLDRRMRSTHSLEALTQRS